MLSQHSYITSWYAVMLVSTVLLKLVMTLVASHATSKHPVGCMAVSHPCTVDMAETAAQVTPINGLTAQAKSHKNIVIAMVCISQQH